jgi:hypothetical protein
MAVPDWQKQIQLNAVEAGAVALSPNINSVTGNAAKLVTGGSGRLLVIACDKGSARIRLGDHVADMAGTAEFPAADITDGTSAIYIPQGASVVFPAFATWTVKLFGTDPALSYWYV